MFWKRKENKDSDAKTAKLPGPREINDTVKKQLDPARVDPDSLQFLKMLVKPNGKGERCFDFRIYDPSEAESIKLQVANFNSLDSARELVIAEGTLDEATRSAQVNLLRELPKYQLLSPETILQRILKLEKPGDQDYFFVAAGGGTGGPLGRGAVVIKINPTNNGKKRKKYGVYTTSVVNLAPLPAQEGLVYDSDKAPDIAKWVVESHKPRFC